MSPKVIRRYALRAEVRENFRDELDKFLSKCQGYIVAYEEVDGENPHVHVILSSDKSLKGVRHDFSRCCPDHKGNAMYSLKECDDDFHAYIRYICKGKDKDTPPVIWSRCGLDYCEDVIQAAHRAYYVNQEAVIENSKRRKKVDAGNVVEQVERVCKARGYKSYQREEIASVYLDLFRDARKGINVFAAKAVVNTVCLLLDSPECQRRALAAKIAEL